MLYLLMLALTVAASFFAPWWAMAPLAFLAALFLSRSSRQAFWSPLLGVSSAWLLLMIYTMITTSNHLMYRMTALLRLPHWGVLVMGASLAGGLLAGMAGLSGRLIRNLVHRPAGKTEPAHEPALSFILPDFNLQ